MGYGYHCHCEECGNDASFSVGVGFAFPEVYQNTLADARDGRYGEEWQGLALSSDYVAIDAEDKLYRCGECGYWEAAADLSLYAPKDVGSLRSKRYGEKTVAEWGRVPYVCQPDSDGGYVLLKRREHPCAKCGAPMQPVALDGASDRVELKCPECGGKMFAENTLLWD